MSGLVSLRVPNGTIELTLPVIDDGYQRYLAHSGRSGIGNRSPTVHQVARRYRLSWGVAGCETDTGQAVAFRIGQYYLRILASDLSKPPLVSQNRIQIMSMLRNQRTAWIGHSVVIGSDVGRRPKAWQPVA